MGGRLPPRKLIMRRTAQLFKNVIYRAGKVTTATHIAFENYLQEMIAYKKIPAKSAERDRLVLKNCSPKGWRGPKGADCPLRNILFTRIGCPTVVLGANQIPQMECRLDIMKEDGVEPIMRSSGGGTVYIDSGNSLVGLITTSTKNYNETNPLFIDAINNCFNAGVQASGRNDLVVDGKKVGGAAFHIKMDTFLHHACILVNGDLNIMSKYLNPNKLKLQSKGIKSVRSRVINLIEFNQERSVIDLNESFHREFTSRFPNPEIIDITEDEMLKIPAVMEKRNAIKHKTVVLDHLPAFNGNYEYRFDWGTIGVFLIIKNNKIVEVTVNTDSLRIDISQKIKELYLGKEFNQKTFDIVIDDAEIDELSRHILGDLKLDNIA